ANVIEKTRFHTDCRAHAQPGHRREYGGVQSAQRLFVSAVTLLVAGPACWFLHWQGGGEWGFISVLPRRARSERGLLWVSRLSFRDGESERRRGRKERLSLGLSGFGKLLRYARCSRGDGKGPDRGRRPGSRGASGRRAESRLLAKALRRRHIDRRQKCFAQRARIHGHRRDASGLLRHRAADGARILRADDDTATD